MRRDSAIKNLLKIFLFIFYIYIFTIKIFLKNTLLCFDLQNKERRRQETHYYASKVRISDFPARFKADFGLFWLYRPYRSSADTTRYCRYGPILAESARFGANRAASAQIESSWSESEKKNKKKNSDAAPT